MHLQRDHQVANRGGGDRIAELSETVVAPAPPDARMVPDARQRMIAEAIENSSIRLESLLVDDGPTPAENVLQQEQILNLSVALEKLPQSQRQALVLQVWQGWSLTEIAEHMGKTPQAVAGLLKRGLRQLRTEMGEADASSNVPVS